MLVWKGLCSAGMAAPRVRQYLLLFTVLGEGRARFVHAKWSVAPLSMVKHHGFVTFFEASWVPLVLPGCLLGASWVLSGNLLGASAWCLCLLGASWVPPSHDSSPMIPFPLVLPDDPLCQDFSHDASSMIPPP